MSTVVLKIRSVFRKSPNRFVPEFQNCIPKASTLLCGLFSPRTNQSAMKAKQNQTCEPGGAHLTLGLNSHSKVAATQGGIHLAETSQVNISGPHAYTRADRPTNLRHGAT